MADRREVSVVEQKAFVDRVEKWLPAVVVISALTGFSVLAWYAYTTSTQSANEEDLLIVEAEKTQMKEKPLDPGGMKFPNQDKTVFETFSNGSQQPPKVERVLPAPEEPMPRHLDTTGTKTWVNEKLHKGVRDGVREGLPADDGSAPREQVIGSEDDTMSTSDTGSNATAAVQQMQAMERLPGNVPDNANPEEIMSFKNATITAKKEEPVIKGETWEDASRQIAEEETVATPVVETPAPAAEVKLAAPAPTPAPTPAPAPKVEAKTEARPAVAPSAGGLRVQLGAYQSEKEATTELAKIRKKFPAASGHAESIYRAVVPGRGTFYRLRLGGFATAADVKSFCAGLSAGGQACIAAKD